MSRLLTAFNILMGTFDVMHTGVQTAASQKGTTLFITLTKHLDMPCQSVSVSGGVAGRAAVQWSEGRDTLRHDQRVHERRCLGMYGQML